MKNNKKDPDYHKKYYQANRERLIEQQKKYYHENKELLKQKRKESKPEKEVVAGSPEVNSKTPINTVKNSLNDEAKKTMFEKCIKESESTMFLVAFRVVRQREWAEDIVQESITKAWVHFDEFEEDKKFSSWITSIVRNAAIDSLRVNKKRSQTYSFNDTDTALHRDTKISHEIDYVDKTQDVIKNYENQEFAKLIMENIEQLPDNLRSVMEYFVEGYSYNEIADATGLSVPTVRTRVYKAKLNLQKIPNLMQFRNF